MISLFPDAPEEGEEIVVSGIVLEYAPWGEWVIKDCASLFIPQTPPPDELPS